MSDPIVVDIGAAVQMLESNPDLVTQMSSIFGISERHYLSQDNDGHWYVIPVSKASEFGEWLRLDGDDERSWEPPEFAKSVGGSPCLVTFTNPEIA